MLENLNGGDRYTQKVAYLIAEPEVLNARLI
jgi:hypothetical protein